MNDLINDSNFFLYAAQAYDNPQCFMTVEFYDDLNRIKYIKRLFKRYEETGELKERLILNHLIVLYNVFGHEAATKMLFLKLDGFYEMLKPFLILLGHMPEIITGVGLPPKVIRSCDIVMDEKIVTVLRKI